VDARDASACAYCGGIFDKQITQITQFKVLKYKMFGPLFIRALEYAAQLRQAYNIQLPYPTLEARLQFYKVLVTFIAGTLIASKLDPSVNDILSSIAFNEHGMLVDERLPMIALAGGIGSTFDEYLKDAGCPLAS
jgi:hypothetical protein